MVTDEYKEALIKAFRLSANDNKYYIDHLIIEDRDYLLIVHPEKSGTIPVCVLPKPKQYELPFLNQNEVSDKYNVKDFAYFSWNENSSPVN